MHLGTLLPAIIFGLIGLFVIIYILSKLLGTLLGEVRLRGALERLRFRRKKQLLQQAKEKLRKGEYHSSLPVLRDAFCLRHVKCDAKMIEAVHDHHFSILQALLSASRSDPSRLSNLPAVEELLINRTAAMKAFVETMIAAKALSGRPKSGRQRPPEWAVAEFRRKLRELQTKIDGNQAELRKELDKLFSNAGASSEDQPVIYH